MQPPEGPPVWTAFTAPSGAPPPIVSTTVRRLVPIGTSTRPVWRTAPERANTLVPRLPSVPIAAYQAPPSRRIVGTAAKVSTLLIRVGAPHRPAWAG